jgi:hypothetical protein
MCGLDSRIHLPRKMNCASDEDGLFREADGLPGQVYDRAGQGRTRLPGNDDVVACIPIKPGNESLRLDSGSALRAPRIDH